MLNRIPSILIAPLAIALILLLLVTAYFVLLTREYIEIDKGSSKEVKQNPFFAAQHYVKDKTHITWRSHQALRQLQGAQLTWQDSQLGPGDTLILVDSYGSLSDEEAENIWSWVEQGGHLIYHLDNPFIDIDRIPTDLILEYLGLELAEKPAKDELAEETQQNEPHEQPTPKVVSQPAKPVYYPLKSTPIRRAEHCFRNINTASILLPDHNKPVLVDSMVGRGVVSSDDFPTTLWEFGNAKRLAALALEVKQGRITLLNSLSAWENSSIDCADNGYFLKASVGPGRNVAWFVNLDAPNLWQRLWTLAPESVLACIVALIAWLWHVNVRFGEPLLEKPTQRRAFLDHFKAWSNYLWRPALITAQIMAQRQDCLQRAARRVPGFARLTQSDQLRHMAQLTGLADPLIERALFSPVEHHAQRVTDIIYALQQLRSHL